MLVKYVGDLSPMRITVGESIFNEWKTNEVRDIDDKEGHILIKLKTFKQIIDKKETVENKSSITVKK